MKTRKGIANISMAAMVLLVLCGVFSACSKSNNSGPSGPPPPTNPGGYDSSNQIAGLVAYWSFNGTVNDSKSGIAGTANNTTYTTGWLTGSQALQGSSPNGFVLTSTAGAAIQSMKSFSLSFWINSAQVTNGAQAIFNLILDSAVTGGWPALDVDLEGFGATSDSLNIKLYMRNTQYPWAGQGFQSYLDTAVGKWTHVVWTYNAANSTVNAYENGVAAGIFNYPYGPSQAPPTTTQGPITVYGNDPGSATNTNGAPLWQPSFTGTGGIVFVDWQTSTTPNSAPTSSSGPLGTWAVPYVGGLSHFRIYNTALNSSDVNSLYILEKAGF